MRINEDIKATWRLALRLFLHPQSAPYNAGQLSRRIVNKISSCSSVVPYEVYLVTFHPP